MASSDIKIRADVEMFMAGEPLSVGRLNKLVQAINRVDAEQRTAGLGGVIAGGLALAGSVRQRVTRRQFLTFGLLR